MTELAPPLMRRMGAGLVIVRPDQVVAATWPADQPGETEFLDQTMAVLCGQAGVKTTWTRSH